MVGRDFCRLHKYYFWMAVYFLSTCRLRIKWMAGNSLHQSSFILLTMLSMGTFIQLLAPCPTPTYRAEPDCRIPGYFWDPRPVAPFNKTKLRSERSLRNQANSPGWARSELTVIQVCLWPWILRTVWSVTTIPGTFTSLPSMWKLGYAFLSCSPPQVLRESPTEPGAHQIG